MERQCYNMAGMSPAGSDAGGDPFCRLWGCQDKSRDFMAIIQVVLGLECNYSKNIIAIIVLSYSLFALLPLIELFVLFIIIAIIEINVRFCILLKLIV